MKTERVQKVRARGVSRSFGPTWALRDVDASFAAGDLNLVVGANGSGKSTLLGIVGTLLKPTRGVVEYAPDCSLTQVRSQIGWGSHESMLYLDLSVRENLMFAAKLLGIDPGRSWASAAQRFGLQRFGDQPVRVLSRGQKQRAALARALLHDPSLLVLDEPTTGLDTEGAARLLSVLAEQLKAGAVIIVVTHEPEMFESMPCRLTRLDRGRVVHEPPARG
jgi:ABC-type multidrug transport system ATPase subunit